MFKFLYKKNLKITYKIMFFIRLKIRVEKKNYFLCALKSVSRKKLGDGGNMTLTSNFTIMQTLFLYDLTRHENNRNNLFKIR